MQLGFRSHATTALRIHARYAFVSAFSGRPARYSQWTTARRLCVRAAPRAKRTSPRAIATDTPPSAGVKSETSYDASDIQVLEGLEPVRKRPGMYIGTTGPRGLHHLVFEVVDNAVDEALAGHCSRVTVSLHADGSVSVRDDGRGIPTDVHPTTGKSALETVLTVLHAGGKFGGTGYKVSGGLHGVGVSVVNALSEWLSVDVWRDGCIHTMRFARGVPQGSMTCVAAEEEPGTRVRFLPDSDIFTTTVDFDLPTLSRRLDELAYLNAGLEIVLREERVNDGAPTEHVYLHKGGITEYAEKLCQGKQPLHEQPSVIFVSNEVKGVGVEIALRWNSDAYSDALLAFANNIRTIDGGTHIEGLRTAITRTINQLARKSGKLRESSSNLSGDYVREGLTAIVSVKVPDPEFEGQTKSKLGNPEVRAIVDGVCARGLVDFFEFHPRVLADVVEKAMSAQAAAEAARRARDIVRRKNVLESTTLPGKLADCVTRNVEECEVFVVEGESAGGSAKQARDRMNQAILPIRGKILNIEKTDDAKIYRNTEVQALITALGLGVRGEDFDADALRYHKIIIMTDADVDGAHIRTLLLTFFFRYSRKLIENGFVYIACPPLYKFERGKDKVYLYTEEEKDRYIREHVASGQKYALQRFKGLGEMMPQQLWTTTMDPGRRQLKRVEIEDAVVADSIFTVLMGNRVAPRKEFIESHAASLSLDDIDV